MFTRQEIHALAGSKKTEILRQLEKTIQEMDKSLHLHVKPKKEDGVNEMKAVLEVLKSSAHSPVVGTLPKVI